MPHYVSKIRWSLALLTLSLVLPSAAWAGPYPGAAGQAGSDAINYLDGRFQEWASGYLNYVKGSPINNSYTDPTQTLGPAKGTTTGITELGDGGQITLTFARPILASGSGPDFAVFGNSFSSGYLKLAYVDVSQDDVNWFRMPNYSLTPNPITTFGNNMDPTNISGLAGKYVVGYGTPFSLSSVGLQWASYVRLVDVIGDGSNLDSNGNPIYDPTPASNGFNAGGVGVLSEAAAVVPEPRSIVLILIAASLVLLARVRPWRVVRSVANFLFRETPMIRWFILALSLALVPSTRADYQTSTFEDLGLGANSYNNNLGTGGYFQSGVNSFNNLYDPTYGDWSGWSISSQTNTANPEGKTPDYNFEYTSITGGGANGSSTYAVASTFGPGANLTHPSTSIVNLGSGLPPVSIQVTNTAYDYYSMVYGDGFAHKFAAGDFLQLTISGYSSSGGSGSQVGEVDLYLANFLGTNTFILANWLTVDLSSLKGAQSLVFGLRSSDNDPTYGMNTPPEFAVDNLITGSASVPEPSSLILGLIGSGMAVGAGVARRRKGQPAPLCKGRRA